MRKDKQEQGNGLAEIGMSLDDLVRRGARQIIHQAIVGILAQRDRSFWPIVTDDSGLS